MSAHHVGERLSLNGHLCTVRYIGEVRGKPGTWLGVEWDEPSRGKHAGSFQGHEYFRCRSLTPTPGSFIKSSASWDKPCGFLHALRRKYADEDNRPRRILDSSLVQTGKSSDRTVFISGKQVEEFDYENINRRNAQLNNLRIAVLDHMLIKATGSTLEGSSVQDVCPNIVELDLRMNLLESLNEIAELCKDLRNLRSLTLDGNRLNCFSLCEASRTPDPFAGVTSLGLDSMLLNWTELENLLSHFPALQNLSCSNNELHGDAACQLPPKLASASFDGNAFTSVEDLACIAASCHNLATLSMKDNKISKLVANGGPDSLQGSTLQFPTSLSRLDLSSNQISAWSFIDGLPLLFPGLRHLRLTRNPLYEQQSATEGLPLAETDVSMLAIARLPRLISLNYFTITEKERLNAEAYYLSVIAAEIEKAAPEMEHAVRARHPRYDALCKEYGQPRITRKTDGNIDPNSLAARLVTCRFYCAEAESQTTLPSRPEPVIIEIPKSFNIYTVFAMLSKRLDLRPMSFSLTWESGEKELAALPKKAQNIVEAWDSDDEEVPAASVIWADREVDLRPSTRPVGTIIEADSAWVRVTLLTSRNAWK